MRLGIAGAAGRMGQMLVREASATAAVIVASASEALGSPMLGKDAGEVAGLGSLGVAIVDDPRALFEAADVVLDFTAPAASLGHAAIAARTGKAFVVGTTGIAKDQEQAFAEAGKRAVVVRAANFSLGVNLMLALVQRAAASLDPAWDIEIVEMHHRHKVDAPSGTALALGHAAAKGRGVALDEVAERGRDGVTGARNKGAIGFAALRGGDVAGEHTVVFAADGERLELTHKATTRGIFARGALKAALWTQGRAPGLYSMTDVLGL
ncbi:MAG: 4-hydroxy-tetrahydrodipicolinate reductase [Alphaproteobacteria bacterium]